MARISVCLLALFSVFAAVGAAAQSTFPALLSEKPSAENRDQLMLFGQFVGSWQFESVEYHDDGSRPTQKGEIYFHWVLQGTAVQDVWIEAERSDSDLKEYGTTVRFYDPKTKSWKVTWIEPLRGAATILKVRRSATRLLWLANSPTVLRCAGSFPISNRIPFIGTERHWWGKTGALMRTCGLVASSKALRFRVTRGKHESFRQ